MEKLIPGVFLMTVGIVFVMRHENFGRWANDWERRFFWKPFFGDFEVKFSQAMFFIVGLLIFIMGILSMFGIGRA